VPAGQALRVLRIHDNLSLDGIAMTGRGSAALALWALPSRLMRYKAGWPTSSFVCTTAASRHLEGCPSCDED
jgi:hypothetical protein